VTEEALAVAHAIAATWPPETVLRDGAFDLALGAGGGNRVSAARLADPASDGAAIAPGDIAKVAARQRDAGQEALFMVMGWQGPLDRTLAEAGYGTRDATDMLAVPVETIAAPPPRLSCFDIWPPLAVQEEIWADGGIGPARLAVMHRVQVPRTSIFGRIADRPAGTAFVAVHGETAMLHALEIAARARRQGLARTMMQAAAHWAQGQGARRFSVLVTQANAGAQGLYASLGMKAVEQYHYRVA
jgi:GNAT superfamily N-acetyltransferase